MWEPMKKILWSFKLGYFYISYWNFIIEEFFYCLWIIVYKIFGIFYPYLTEWKGGEKTDYDSRLKIWFLFVAVNKGAKWILHVCVERRSLIN